MYYKIIHPTLFNDTVYVASIEMGDGSEWGVGKDLEGSDLFHDTIPAIS
jgi:hypothetical protein